MRSRYSAYAVGQLPYLVETWHPATRPAAVEPDPDAGWYRLDIISKHKGGPFDTEGIVEFEAFYRGGSQREASRFVRENGRWFYVTAV
jgi:SEC-C motif-containing protein